MFGDIRYVEPASPATTLLVFSLFGEFGVVPSAEQARLLLFGLSTDTGFFRHLRGDSAETLRAAALLTEPGNSPADVFAMVYGGRTIENRKLLARMIERAESYLVDRLLLTWLTLDDRREVSRYQRGDDDLYCLLQTVSGNEVVVLFREEQGGSFSIGLRSTTVDVGAVARSFGGGGHVGRTPMLRLELDLLAASTGTERSLWLQPVYTGLRCCARQGKEPLEGQKLHHLRRKEGRIRIHAQRAVDDVPEGH